MEFRMQVKPINRADSWWEDYNKPEATDQASAEVAAQKIVDYFNSTLRPHESAREILAVEFTPNTNTSASSAPKTSVARAWEKTNLVTVHERGQYFDRLVCPSCGITAKRYGVSSIVIDSKFKAKGYKSCDTAKVLFEKRQRT